jgi:4'-phosphopantetheinyl transferase
VTRSFTEWRPLVDLPEMSPHDVHLFLIYRDSPHPTEGEVLSADELSRASRFVSPTDRQGYIAARSAMRGVLAHYTGTTAAALEFAYSERGRPSLKSPAIPLIDFNLAHSGDVALLAVCSSRVGVDVEPLRQRPQDFMDIATRFFSPGEASALAQLPSAARWRAFVSAWTMKEAVTKALGVGVTGLSEVEVRLSPAQPPALLSAPGGAARWRIFQVEIGNDYLGAVAVESGVERLSTWAWSPGTADDD